MIIVDIWDGEFSTEHVARYILPVKEALQLTKTELASGFLVNLRKEITWGPEVNFDERIINVSH